MRYFWFFAAPGRDATSPPDLTTTTTTTSPVAFALLYSVLIRLTKTPHDYTRKHPFKALPVPGRLAPLVPGVRGRERSGGQNRIGGALHTVSGATSAPERSAGRPCGTRIYGCSTVYYGCSYMLHLSGNNRRNSHFMGS